MKLQEFFQRYWQQGLYALLVAAFGWLWKLVKKIKADNDATRDGMTALLRAEIIATYNHYADKGCYLPIYARENLHNLYQQYKTLGGNGAIDNLVELTFAWPTMPKEDEENEN